MSPMVYIPEHRRSVMVVEQLHPCCAHCRHDSDQRGHAYACSYGCDGPLPKHRAVMGL